MKEIGGYLEMEVCQGQEFYPDLFKLNLGRTAAALYLVESGCRCVYLPRFLCSSVIDTVGALPLSVRFYGILEDFMPDPATLPDRRLDEGECLYLVNAYGLLSDEQLASVRDRWGQVLLDFTHAFFQAPIEGVAAVASIRKFFGVTDGAYLKSDLPLTLPQEQDSSCDRFAHVLGRFEQGAGAFYQAMLDTAHSYEGAAAKRMSPLTENLLKGIDYDHVMRRRMENYQVLSEALNRENGLAESGVLRTPDRGPFVYPLLVQDGPALRKALAAQKIFVPTYWTNVIGSCPEGSVEHRYAAHILALPCDQRYGVQEMERVAEAVRG